MLLYKIELKLQLELQLSNIMTAVTISNPNFLLLAKYVCTYSFLIMIGIMITENILFLFVVDFVNSFYIFTIFLYIPTSFEIYNFMSSTAQLMDAAFWQP